MHRLRTAFGFFVFLFFLSGISTAAIIADHHSPELFDQIPQSNFGQLRSSFDIFYGHTSHGGQIITGIGMLASEYGPELAAPTFHEISDDLGYANDISWVQPTRDWLDAHPETNVVMWSWCGGMSTNTEEGVSTYLNAMSQLEMDYPEVVFVYMTGHLDGTGVDGTLYLRNNQIREFCSSNDKVLFDFADIESYDPDGNLFPDESDACGWCTTWCETHECPTCGYCAHSHCFNCYQKGKAFWWLLYQLNGNVAGISPGDVPEASIALGQNYPNPFNPRTDIKVTIQKPGNGFLAVYDLAGNRIDTIYEGYFPEGSSEFTWKANRPSGEPIGSGVYFCRLKVGDTVQQIKMTLVQ